jgi:hypothetical protein
MDNTELNEIKGTQSGQFLNLIIFFGENLMKSKAHS